MMQQVEKLLTSVGQKYMEDQPPASYQFRVMNYAGFTRGKDFRYDLNMIEALPNLQNNQYVYAWSKLWMEEAQELPLSLSCYGPTQVFLNGERVHYANIEEEVFPERRSWFRLSLAKGWNHFVLRFMKTETGCGAKFGTGSIKGFPLHFIMPSLERAGGEGWIYTGALKADLPIIPSTERSEYEDGISWYPNATWSSDERELTAIERIFTNGEQGNYAIGWTMISNENDSAVQLSGSYKGELQIFIDGQLQFQALSVGEGEHDFEFTADVAKGRAYSLMIQSQHTSVGWGFKFNNEYVRQNSPVSVAGTSENWFYSGPYVTVNEALREQIIELSNLHTTKNGLDYWYIDAPFSRIRPFVETTHYGKWNYPLGVTLYGLLSTGKILSIESFESYVQNHIELCTKYYEYAKWDCKQYGAPGINQQIVLMDSLDDCGSFGATMLFTMENYPLIGGASVAERIAGFITDEQQRLPNGTLYRLKGSTDFMQHTMWCDDLYMCVPFLVRYYRYTQDIRYIDDAVHQILQYRHSLYREELQIMHHVYDMKFNKQNTVSWGRGNGWVIFSLAELLAELSPQHEKYGELLTMFRQLSHGYQQLQGKRGMWHQIVDDHDSYEETSCTAMFIYAMARGVQNGWYDNPIPYVESVYYGWEALAQYAVDEAGNILGVCRGSGYSYNYEYYKYDLLPRLNDTHGIGIVMLAGIEIIKLRTFLS